jgi:minor extracellular protease Epr
MKKLIALILVVLVVLIIPVTAIKAEEEKNIKVAIIDSGIDENNPLLDYSRIAPGKSYIEEISSCDDKIGHGTAIAGIIQSYAPNAYLVPLMYYSRHPSGVPANGGIEAICNAIYDAIDIYDCKIINISSCIYAENDELESAIAYAESKNVIVISAVGNDMLNNSSRVFYPAVYDTVIGVGAIDSDLEIANFSQQNNSVMTVAYGVDIKVLSIKNNLEYTVVSGTSYSAAAFCGLAAKYIEEYPDITAEQFRKIISCSCKDLGEAGYDTAYGFGLVDEDKLLENMQLLKNTLKHAAKLLLPFPL